MCGWGGTQLHSPPLILDWVLPRPLDHTSLLIKETTVLSGAQGVIIMTNANNITGFILTGGNLFFHHNIKISITDVKFSVGNPPTSLLFLKSDGDFIQIVNFFNEKKIVFSMYRNALLKQGTGFFPISLKIEKEKILPFVMEEENKSRFVYCEQD